MSEWSDSLAVVKDIGIVVATIIATAYATLRLSDRGDRIKVCKGFLQEIRQNTYLAKHNMEQVYGKARTLFFRDDFWNMSKASGHFLDMPSNVQSLLYEIYMKQYKINEDLNLVGKVMTLQPVQEEIKDSLLPKLSNAESLLLKTLDP